MRHIGRHWGERLGGLVVAGGLGIGLGLGLGACAERPSEPERTGAAAAAERAAERPSDGRVLLAWGSGPGALGYRAPGFERVAEGPSALALAPDGSVLVLDRLAGRIARVGAGGALETFASVPEDAEDVAVGPDGAVVAWSPLRAQAWLFEAAGAAAGELALSRSLREVVGLELGASRRVAARTAYQELVDLGSPAAPTPLEVGLAGKREGAFVDDAGRGLAARVSRGTAELWVVLQAGPAATGAAASPGRRAEPVARHAIPGAVDAARVVGRSGDIACLRLERVVAEPAVAVTRRAVCLDARDGALVLDVELPPPGTYLPRRELAVGPAGLVHGRPTADGLELVRHVLPADLARAEVSR
ncbi:MAG: hypothetical protein HY908_15650 [Myxococcales bacterium]|nr:hypothetical protein [Myxococcales bacterium]